MKKKKKIVLSVLLFLVVLFAYETYDYIFNPRKSTIVFKEGDFKYRFISYYNGSKGGSATLYCYLKGVHKMENQEIFQFVMLIHKNREIDATNEVVLNESEINNLFIKREPFIIVLTSKNVMKEYDLYSYGEAVYVKYNTDTLCLKFTKFGEKQSEVCEHIY